MPGLEQTKHSVSAQTPTLNHDGGRRRMIYLCFTHTALGYLAVIELIRNAVYQSIQDSDVRTSVRQLMLGPNWLMKQNNDLKNSKKNLKKILNQKD